MTRPGKIVAQAGFEPWIFRSRGGRLNCQANQTVDSIAATAVDLVAAAAAAAAAVATATFTYLLTYLCPSLPVEHRPFTTPRHCTLFWAVLATPDELVPCCFSSASVATTFAYPESFADIFLVATFAILSRSHSKTGKKQIRGKVHAVQEKNTFSMSFCPLGSQSIFFFFFFFF